MVGIDVGQGGVFAGPLCEGTTGEAVCGVGSFRTSERQRTRGLRTGAYVEEFGNTGISNRLWHGLICHGRWCHWSITRCGRTFILGITRRVGRTEVKGCLFICVTKRIVEIMSRKLSFHFRKSNVISSFSDNCIATTNPHFCKIFVPIDDPGTQPAHRPLTFSLIVSLPKHDSVSDCNTDL